MFEDEIKKYTKLNELAKSGGIVIFGGKNDKSIPLCELKQAFSIGETLYNRSIDGLSVTNAADVYDACVAPICPETVILHIGEAEADSFETAPAEFDIKYSELIRHIKAVNGCRIAVVSVKNSGAGANADRINEHLRHIAETERCEFCDISVRRLWNPKNTETLMSFINDIGFERPLKIKRPVYDLVKIFYCC